VAPAAHADPSRSNGPAGWRSRSPLRNLRGLVAWMRRWSRRHRVGLRSAAAMLALVTLVGLPSAVIWDVMAGERIRLAQQHVTVTTDPPVPQPTTPDRPAGPHRPNLHASAPAARATTSAAPATTISGTAIAIGLIVLLAALALFVARIMLLRPPAAAVAAESVDADPVEILIEPDAAEPDQDPDADHHPEPDQNPRPDRDPDQDREPDQETAPRQNAERVSVADTDLQPVSVFAAPAAESLPQPSPPTAATPGTATAKPPLEPPARGAASDRASGEGPVILYDRRLAQRVAYQSKARLQWDGHDVACISEDIGMRGVRLRFPGDLPAAPPPPAGTTVRVTLTLDGTLTTLKARVGWQRSDETSPLLGLQFLGVQSRHETLLQPIVLRGTPI
jgi:hypothetical protein